MIDRLTLLDRPELTTERLLLRRPNVGDVAAIVDIVGDWEVASRLARVPHPYGIADAKFFLEQVVPREWVWAITIDGSDGLIGAIGLTPEKEADSAELGYWLSKSYWGQGVITEAATAVVIFGFYTLRLPLITSGYFEDNSVSGRVLKKLGFVEVGQAMRPCLAADKDMPSIELHLLPKRQD